MRYRQNRARFALLGALTLAAVLVPVTAASATTAKTVTLNGDWAPFNRCPVDNPVMLAADGVTNVALCVASNAPSGSVKVGNLTLTGSQSNLQFGLINNVSTGFSVVSPPGGALAVAPALVPGGLQALLCPSKNPVISQDCEHLARNNKLNQVTATIESAGNPSNFSLAAGLSSGLPILTLPVKIQLKNPLLGPHCSIGSTASPIVLHPENVTTPNVQAEAFDANGTPDPAGVLLTIFSLGGTQGDTTFSVPGATGCGPAGLADALINHNESLPAASGNSVVLNDASAHLTGSANPPAAAPNQGRDLSAYWHSAVLP
jgi:hypothetical protein